MRRIKVVFHVILIGMFFMSTNVLKVAASEVPVMNTFSEIFIEAAVPESFTGDIAIEFLQENTQVKFTTVLTLNNNYTDSISVVNNNAYTVTVATEKGYITDMLDKFDVRGENLQLKIKVRESTLSDDIKENLINPHGEETWLEGRMEPEDVLSEYLKKVSFAQSDMAFDTFFALYGGSMFLEYYIQIDSMNTQETWDKMSNFDRFNHYITYTMPSTKLSKYSYSNVNEFLEELSAQKNMLSQIKGGEIVYGAIIAVWEWLYEYWNYSGTVYNFYDYYKPSSAGSVQDTLNEPAILAENTSDKSPAVPIAKEELHQNQVKSKAESKIVFETIIQRNIITICIFVALISIFFIYKYKKKGKSNDF